MKFSAPLIGLLLATLAMSGWVAQRVDDDEALVRPVVRTTGDGRSVGRAALPEAAVGARAATARTTASRVGSAELAMARAAWPPPEPEGTMAWQAAAAAAAIAEPAPPPLPARAEPPPTPQAPPFPYTLIGRFEDAGGARALLSNALRTISAAPGELIDGQWRIDAVQSGSVELTWLPGGLRQTIAYRPS